MNQTPQQQIADLKKEADKFLVYLEAGTVKAFRDVFKNLDKTSQDSVEALKLVVQSLEKEFISVENKARDLYLAIKATTTEQDNSKKLTRDINKEYSVLVKASRSLSDSEAEIGDLTKGQIKNLITKVKSSQAQLKVLSEINKTTNTYKELSEDTKNLLKDQSKFYKSILDLAEQQLKDTSRYNSALGVTGALLDNVNKIGIRAFGGIGINLGILGEGLEEAKIAAEDMAKSLTKGTNNVITFGDRFKVLKAALPGIKEGLTGAISDPLVTITALSSQILKAFLAYDQASIELSRYTGQTAGYADLMNSKFVTGAELMTFMSQASKELGINVKAVFDRNTIATAAEFSKMLGLSSTEAGKLAMFSTVNGKSLDNNVKHILDTVNGFNKANRSAVVHGQVLRDIGNISDGIAASMGTSVIKLSQAASQARKLGLELSQLDSIASSLLDFESSIENELTAQLLTGKAINLSKARELALTNDLNGLGQELFKNSASLYEFGRLTRIGQEEYAKALGMTRDQLARVAYLQGLNKNMTMEQAAEMAKVNLMDMKRLSAQESIATSMAKLAEAFAPILVYASKFLGTTTGMGIAVGTLVTLMGVKLVAGLMKASTQAKILAGIMGKVKDDTRLTALASGQILPTANPNLGQYSKGSTLVSGKKVGGQFVSLKNTGKAGAGLLRGAGTASMFGPKGWIIAAVLAALGGVAYGISKLKEEEDVQSIQDGVISPSGGLLVSGPKGSFKTNPDDYLIATTTPPGGQDNQALIRKIDELISAVNRTGDVYLDGNKVGQALVLGTSRFS